MLVENADDGSAFLDLNDDCLIMNLGAKQAISTVTANIECAHNQICHLCGGCVVRHKVVGDSNDLNLMLLVAVLLNYAHVHIGKSIVRNIHWQIIRNLLVDYIPNLVGLNHGNEHLTGDHLR